MSNDKKLQLEIERERQAKALEQYLKTGHGTPRSRREFLASGVLAFGGYIVAPSILQLVSANAQAQAAGNCVVNVTAGLVPFINVNLAGGAGLHSNTVPLTMQGAMLTSYDKIGLGAPANFSVIRDFGNVPFATTTAGASLSPFLDGIKSVTTTTKTAWVNVMVRSQDDTSNNEMSIAGLVEKAGLKGTTLPNLGSTASRTGVGQLPAFNAPSQPLKVSNVNDIISAMTVDSAYNGMSTTQKKLAS